MDVNSIASRQNTLPITHAHKGLDKAAQKSDAKGLDNAVAETSEARALPEGVGQSVNVEA